MKSGELVIYGICVLASWLCNIVTSLRVEWIYRGSEVNQLTQQAIWQYLLIMTIYYIAIDTFPVSYTHLTLPTKA